MNRCFEWFCWCYIWCYVCWRRELLVWKQQWLKMFVFNDILRKPPIEEPFTFRCFAHKLSNRSWSIAWTCVVTFLQPIHSLATLLFLSITVCMELAVLVHGPSNFGQPSQQLTCQAVKESTATHKEASDLRDSWNIATWNTDRPPWIIPILHWPSNFLTS